EVVVVVVGDCGWSDSGSRVSDGRDGGDGSRVNGNIGESGDANKRYSGDCIANGGGSGDGGGNELNLDYSEPAWDLQGLLCRKFEPRHRPFGWTERFKQLDSVAESQPHNIVPATGGTVNRKFASDLKGVFCHGFELQHLCPSLMEGLQI
ncbi:hypothetical protein PoB_001024600, partial [Plakobranchus ocellatus]